MVRRRRDVVLAAGTAPVVHFVRLFGTISSTLWSPFKIAHFLIGEKHIADTEYGFTYVFTRPPIYAPCAQFFNGGKGEGGW